MPSQNLSNPVNQIENFLVKIVVEDGLQKGTGFFIAPGWILTCEHVAGAENGPAETAQNIQIEHNQERSTAQVIKSWPHPDLALLKTELNSNYILPLGADPKPAETGVEQFYVAGYPNGGEKNAGSLTFDGVLNRGDSPFIKFKNSEITGGFSGGPIVYKDEGKVCALIIESRSQDYPAGGLGIPVSVLLEKLKEINHPEFDYSYLLPIDSGGAPRADKSTRTAKSEWYIDCDRKNPFNTFVNFAFPSKFDVGGNVTSAKRTKPKFFFIPGLVSDAHNSLIKRFLQKKSRGDDHAVKPVEITKNTTEILSNLIREVNGKIFEEFDISQELQKGAEAQDARVIYNHSKVFDKQSIVFISIDLHLSDYDWTQKSEKQLQAFIEEFISFWSVDYPEGNKNIEVFIFFKLKFRGTSIERKEELSFLGRFLGRVKKKKKQKREVEFLNKIKQQFNDKNICTTFEPLTLVKFEDVESLFDAHQIREKEEYSELHSKFANGVEWRMGEVEKNITDWINKHHKN